MAKRVTGPEIEKLIQLLAKVPGLGPRSARRAALHLVKKKEQLLGPLADAMGDAYAKVRICSCCGNVDTSDPCSVCTDDRRDNSVIIVVEDVSDLWALERAGAMNTAYHVLGGTLSPLDGIGPDDLNIKGLIERVGKGGVREVIVAVNATVEGQTTAHYITDQLGGLHIKITRLAHGVPVGGELDYLDEGTLTAALRARTVI
jgi:recombination protein RecR